MEHRLFVTFVRHGETALNAQRLLQGHTDTPLSEIGMKQAQLLGTKIADEKFTRAISSDLQRAYHTAQIILQNSNHPGMEVTKDIRLRERGFGENEGKPTQQLFDAAAEVNLSVTDYTPAGGEPYIAVTKRAETFFQDFCTESENTDGTENLLIVSHGGWLQCLMKYLHKNENLYSLENFNPSKAMKIARNTGVYKLSICPLPNNAPGKKYQVSFSAIDDHSHLNSE